MKVGNIVNWHLSRERWDVLLSVLLPLVLMIESGYANGWVYADGNLSLKSPNTYLALGRGLFLEVLIYAMFKLVRVLILKRQWVVVLIPFAIGCVTMTVSAGLNIGWANRSGEMASIVTTVGQFLPPFVLSLFKIGVGLAFPLAVAACALLDVGALVDEMLRASAHMNERAARVQVAEQHQQLWMQKQKESTKELESEYELMAKTDARNMVNRVKQGDYSFGINDAQKSSVQPSVTRIAPVPMQQPQLSQPGVINGQSFPAGPSTGGTQPIQVPPALSPLQAQPGLLNKVNHALFGGGQKQ
jgi:hypothetical protein